MFLSGRPSQHTIDRFLLASQELPLSYGPIGIARAEAPRQGPVARGERLTAFDGLCIPGGCVAPRSNTPGILGRRALPAGRLARLGATPDVHHGLLDEAVVAIGRGQAAFERARAALIAWKQFDIGWVEIFPRQAPVAVGTVVAVLIRHLGFWSLNGCRVVYSVGGLDDAARFGFAYGTLTNHAEAGEELFEVFIDPRTDEVRYRIRAISWPRMTLARLGRPIVRALQSRFRSHSLAAMERATGAGGIRQ